MKHPDAAPTSRPVRADRTVVFITHANPEDNVFTVWLGAKLAALGYDVWADVLRLRGGQDWQRLLERTLRERAVKVLFVATPAAVEKQGVRNEIQIASSTGTALGDKAFIIPLRLAPFEAPFLVAHAQYIDFSSGWSRGLTELLETLENTYRVPRTATSSDTQWQEIQTMHGTSLRRSAEMLDSNWVAVSALPNRLRYIEFSNGASLDDLEFRLKTCRTPVVRFGNGFISFAGVPELLRHFGLDTLRLRSERDLEATIFEGWPALGIDKRTAQHHFAELTRLGLEQWFHERGLNGYEFANRRFGWWAPTGVAPAGKVSFNWGGVAGLRKIQGASLRRGFNWHFGVTAVPRLWPIRHVRFTSRLIFTEDGMRPVSDPKRMHRLRRTFAKSWRNPRWRDMLQAFLYWLTDGQAQVAVPMSAEQQMVLRLPPMRFRAPVGIPQELDVPEIDDGEAEEIDTGSSEYDDGEINEAEYDEDEEGTE